MSYSDFVRQYLTVAIFEASRWCWSAPCSASSAACCGRTGPQPQKYITYESGVDPVGDGWSQSQIRYYVFALLFVMFDVEAVFIFPWAIQLEVYGGVRSRRDGASSSSSCPRAAVRLAQGRPAVGLVEERHDVPEAAHHAAQPTARKYSLWVYQWGLACCAIEMGAAFGSPRYDVMRLGVIPLPASPRQADLVVDLRHRDRQDGAGRSGGSTSRCPTRST